MKRSALVAWALFVVLFSWRHDVTHRPLTADNQIYFFMAERAASGVAPHISQVDSKNQLGVLVEAAAIRAGRSVGVGDVVATRIASIAFAAMAVALAADLAFLLAAALPGMTAFDATIAGHAAALFLFTARGIAEHASAGNSVKIFLVAFALMALVAMARSASRAAQTVGGSGGPGPAALRGAAAARHRDASTTTADGRGERGTALADVLAGVAAGAAFLCWQPALLLVAAVVFEALVATRGGIRRAATVLGAVLAPVLLYEGWFAWQGGLSEQLRQAYVMPLGSLHRPERLYASLVFLMTEAGGPACLPRVLPVGFTLAALSAAFAAARAPRKTAALLRGGGGLLALVLVAGASALFTFYDHQGVPDLFFPDPFVAVAAALALASAMQASRRRMGSAVAAGVVAATALALVLWQAGVDEMYRGPAEASLDDQRRLAELVRLYKEEFGEVWVYGGVHLLALNHLDNFVPYGLYCDDLAEEMPMKSYRPLHDGRMPEIIVHMRGPLPGAEQYLANDYVEITPAAFAAENAIVWRRVSAQPDAAREADWRDFSPPPAEAAPTPLPSRGPRWEKPTRPPKPGRGGHDLRSSVPASSDGSPVAPAQGSPPGSVRGPRVTAKDSSGEGTDRR